MVNKGLTIGFTANVMKKEYINDPKYIEWDSEVTINAVINALESTGNRVILLEADESIYHKLEKYKSEIDIVFNIAEGLPEVESRESMVPSMLEFLCIPHTGSDSQSLANALDKVTTREILENYGVNNPPFQRFEKYADRLKKGLSFPLVVKPAAEGTSSGLDQKSVVENELQLYRAVKKIINTYSEPAIAEEYLDGREYTVGMIGNLVLPPLYFDLHEMSSKPKVRDLHIKDIDPNYCKVLNCFDSLYKKLVTQTIVAHHALGCYDYNRMDFRERKLDNGKSKRIYFLEMNPLPGLHPTESDLAIEAKHAGIDYNTMINMILIEAIERNQNNQMYKDRFPKPKIKNIASLVQSKKEELRVLGKISEYNIITEISKLDL